MVHIPSIKRSAQYAFSIITGTSTMASLLGYTVRDVNKDLALGYWIGILIAVFFVIAIIIYAIIRSLKNKNYSTVINGKEVMIRVGDLFATEGWKLIPCNERFDTKVDDTIIAHNTLNGKMIDEYITDLQALKNTIIEAQNDTSPLKGRSVKGKVIYPLGRIIPYQEFLMLAFSHFDEQNKAYIGIGEYEQLLIRMWSEIRRVYAAKPITIPLIGAGITDIEGMPEKNYTEFLKCILCTLRSSKFQPDKGITVVLTKDVMDKIDMSVIREGF